MKTLFPRPLAAPLLAAVLAAAGPAGVFAQKSAPRKPASRPAASKPAPPAADMVVATVNGEKIYRSEVARELLADQSARLTVTNENYRDLQRPVAGSIGALVLKKLNSSPSQVVAVTREEIVDWLFKDKHPILLQTVEQLIRERAIAQAARAQGITVTPAEFAERWKESVDAARQNLRLSGMTDSQVFKTLGYREEPARRQVRMLVLLEKLAQADMEAKLGHKIDKGDYVDASHILVRVTETDASKKDQAWEEARKRIEGYRAEIAEGKIEFGAAARQHSDDSSKMNDGKLGVFLRGTMVPEFDKAVFELTPGQISEPVQTAYGWHLIKVNRQGKDTTGPERKAVLQQQVRMRIQNGFLQQLLSRAVIHNTVAPKQQPAMLPQPGE